MSRNAKVTCILASVVTLLAAVYLIDPMTTCLLPACMFHKLTGLYCPGCGSTRALHNLLHGRVTTALRFNALVVLGLAWLAMFGFTQRGRGLLYKSWFGWSLAIAVVAFGVVRNLPSYPFTLLAP